MCLLSHSLISVFGEPVMPGRELFQCCCSYSPLGGGMIRGGWYCVFLYSRVGVALLGSGKIGSPERSPCYKEQSALAYFKDSFSPPCTGSIREFPPTI